jgi:hypothetical protein
MASPDTTYPLVANGRAAPVTDQVLLVASSAESLAQEFRALEQGVHPEADITIEVVTGALESQLEMLYPLREPLANRWLFVPARGNWTAIFHNCPHPGEGVAEGKLSRLVNGPNATPSFEVSCRKGAPSYELTVDGVRGRNIRLVYDGDKFWFFSHGEPFAFEDLNSYKKRGRAKLTSEMMYRYVSELGFDWIWDERNYAPEGVGFLVSSDFDNENFCDIPFDAAKAEWEAFLASGEGLR